MSVEALQMKILTGEDL